jgi:hypothetical protein
MLSTSLDLTPRMKCRYIDKKKYFTIEHSKLKKYEQALKQLSQNSKMKEALEAQNTNKIF